MRGRKRKPAAIRKLLGNASKRPIAPEPSFKVGVPEPPESLKGEGLKEWRRLAPILIGQGVLTEADWSVFAQYCEAQGRYLELWAVRSKERVGSEEWQRIDRAVDRALNHLGKARAELGLTPVTRSKVTMIAKEEPKLAELLSFDGGKK